MCWCSFVGLGLADCLFAEGHCLVEDRLVPAPVEVKVVLAARYSVEVHICDP